MLLRDHPLMSCWGFRNWPPIWSRTRGAGDKHPRGEIGILTSVKFSNALPTDKFFLNIYHQDSEYMGCLLFDNPIFCRQIAKLLKGCCGHAISEIGSLDVSNILLKGIQENKKYGDSQVQRQANPSILLNGLLAAAIAMTEAEMANIQLFEQASGGLKIKVQRGFKQPFLDFFDEVDAGQAACGTALKTGERVVVEDVTSNPIFLGTAALEVMLDAGALAVQSTPLFSPFGHTLGVFSTHYRKPHRPDTRELQVLDRLSYETIKCIGLTL
jgi:GAF domain